MANQQVGAEDANPIIPTINEPNHRTPKSWHPKKPMVKPIWCCAGLSIQWNVGMVLTYIAFTLISLGIRYNEDIERSKWYTNRFAGDKTHQPFRNFGTPFMEVLPWWWWILVADPPCNISMDGASQLVIHKGWVLEFQHPWDLHGTCHHHLRPSQDWRMVPCF